MSGSIQPMPFATDKNLFEVYWGPFMIAAIEADSEEECLEILRRRAGRIWADSHKYPKGMIKITKNNLFYC